MQTMIRLDNLNKLAVTLMNAVGLFLKQLESLERSDWTIRSYYEHLRRLNKYLCEKYNRKIYLSEVTIDHLEEYLNYLLKDKGNSARTRNNMVIVLKSFYRFCNSKGYCSVDIASALYFYTEHRKERLYLSENEVTTILDTVEKPLIGLILETLYYTGMRIGELINLTIEDVKFDEKLVRVLGKGKKERFVPLNENLIPKLSDYLNDWRIETDSDYFFSTRTGTISQVYITKELRNTLILAGMDKKITPHTFRHTYASNLIENGVDLVTLQRLLGHDSLNSTSIYTHSRMERRRDAVNTLNLNSGGVPSNE